MLPNYEIEAHLYDFLVFDEKHTQVIFISTNLYKFLLLQRLQALILPKHKLKKKIELLMRWI